MQQVFGCLKLKNIGAKSGGDILMRKKFLFIIMFTLLSLCGCSAGRETIDYYGMAGGSASEKDVVYVNLQDAGAAEYERTDIIYSLDNIPAYSGQAYIELDGGVPAFSKQDKELTQPFEHYSELDSLGRCGAAYANICPEIMPAEERGAIGQIKPSGWHTEKYNDLIDGNYLYNRCHLIGYQLAGENANEKNLITGTRYLNVEGMLPFENMVDNYVEETQNHVLYRVTPIFEGDNLVASGVEMEGWSVEDKGVGVCFHVYCYNVQPGIEIDYADGESRRAETPDENKQQEAIKSDEGEENSGETKVREYILNTNSKKIHLPDCSSVSSMAEHNKEEYTGTIQELKEKGYQPCGNCLAEYR